MHGRNTKTIDCLFIYFRSPACVMVGMIFIYSSSSVYALERLGCADYYLRKQVAGFLLGVVGAIIARYLPLDLIKRFIPLTFCCELSF